MRQRMFLHLLEQLRELRASPSGGGGLLLRCHRALPTALSSAVVRASLASSGTREYRASVMLKADPLADSEPLIRRVYADVAYRVGDRPEAKT